MAYVSEKDLSKISIGRNLVYKGLVTCCPDHDEECVYIGFDGRFFRVDDYEMKEDKSYSRQLWGGELKAFNFLATTMVFQLQESEEVVTYFTITARDHTPLFIYKDGHLDSVFCFRPKKSESINYEGEIGSTDKYSYSIVSNKSKRLTVPMPKCNYVVKARTLLKDVLNSKLPLIMTSDLESLSIEGLSKDEYTKEYYKKHLEFVINNFSSAEIYYGNLLNDVSEKFKIAKKHFGR